MVLLSNPEIEDISFVPLQNPPQCFLSIPEIDLSDPNSTTVLIKACEDFGFFKVTNHGIQSELIAQLEEQALKFFAMPESDKENARRPDRYGYRSKTIGSNGDMGWVEYLLFEVNNTTISHPSLALLREPFGSRFRSTLNEYVSAVKKLAVDVLELMADGLGIKPRNTLSRLVVDKASESLFRLNHYPSWPVMRDFNYNKIGFGEHTDTKVISVLRSNDSTGLQIALKDGRWVPIQPDPSSFFINVADILQVLTNGRFRSVKHRVLANGLKPRMSMIYFAGPSPTERIAPLAQLIGEQDHSLYREFTWEEYTTVTKNSKLSVNRLAWFEKTPEDL